MANYMKEVAEMLGVTMGEEFEVDCGRGGALIANITNTGLHVISTNMTFCGEDLNITTLNGILVGKYRVKYPPWKPECDGIYYYVELNGDVDDNYWSSDAIDLSLYKLGNCYRTAQEAEANRDKWVAFYASDEVLDL